MPFFRSTTVLLLFSASSVPLSGAFAPLHAGPTASFFLPSAASSSSQLKMAMDASMADRLKNIKRSYQALTERLGDPDVINDSGLLRKVMSERSQIEETVTAYDEYCTLQEELEGARELFNNDDSEMKEMAREEMKEIEPKMEELESKIKILLLPKDPNDDRNIMLEIRAGTGGSEASIFAGKKEAEKS